MPKLKLNPDELKVSSFPTNSAEPREWFGPTTTQSREPTCTEYTLCNPIMC
ncbi:MAG TPA: hypothetical protein VFX98_19125 [Longimicrobiaceae bacterium]|nr:hypothetical protein [Longimicrobiaceae bacterium]